MITVKSYRLGALETNCYLVYDPDTKEGILIDPAEYDDTIADFISSQKLRIIYTVNTHGHYDHIGGNKAFGFPVLIHNLDNGCLSNPLKNLGIVGGGFVAATKALKLLKDQDSIEVKGLSFRVIHTPGHTLGSITLECENTLFTGDTLFSESVGRTDLPFSDPGKLKASLAKLMGFPDNAVVYPGHGRQTTIGHERQYNPFV